MYSFLAIFSLQHHCFLRHQHIFFYCQCLGRPLCFAKDKTATMAHMKETVVRQRLKVVTTKGKERKVEEESKKERKGNENK